MGDAPSRKPTYEELEAENADLRRRVTALEEQLKRALGRIEELERAKKRQAAPFSKGDPKADPKRPGRKPGDDYGKWYCRPPPTRIDETIDVPLPGTCPECGGHHLKELSVEDQFQTDLPQVQPINRRFRVHVGMCRGCGSPVQGRHRLQTSDALGAAAVQLGPNVLSLGTTLNKAFGLSFGKVSSFLERAFGLHASRAAFCRAAERLAKRVQPTYESMVTAARSSTAVNVDETGWKVGGRREWLWTFVTKKYTVYRIAPSRGHDVIESVLGANYAGLVGRDGWAAYDFLTEATHQSCLAHHLARAADILEFAHRGAARFAHAVTRVLRDSLRLRDRRSELSTHGFAAARGRIEARMDRLLEWQPTWGPNAKFVRHLRDERPHLFTFLYHPEIEATNWPAEQAIRPAVITRKVCGGGNRTRRGARAQEILVSFLRTCAQQGRDAIKLFVRALRSRRQVRFALALAPP